MLNKTRYIDMDRLVLLAVMITAFLLLVFIAFFSPEKDIGISYIENCLELSLPSGDVITANEIDGKMIVFLPSYCGDAGLKQDNDQTVLIDDSPAKSIDYNTEHKISISKDNDTLLESIIVFYHSENIYSMFIELNTLNKAEEIEAEYTNARIHVLDPEGSTDYSSSKAHIKGRGNSTYRLDKRAYALKLNSKDSIADLSPSKKYVLLANGYEGSKILNKLVFTLLENVGMEYTTKSQWIDIYVNGDYRGIYLLCESVDIGSSKIDTETLETSNNRLYRALASNHFESEHEKGYFSDRSPDDITGGYIIEKDTDSYYDGSLVGFELNSCRKFTIKYPNNASQDEVQYIHSVVQNIEDLITEDDDSILDYIDVYSFTRRWLVEELIFNSDATVTSYYFYKKAGDPKLYAGPGWDYDGTFGESDGVFRNYWESTLNIGDLRGTRALEWDDYLFNNESYYKMLKETYLDVRPVFIDAYTNIIDEYAKTIRSSAEMDYLRWPELLQNTHYDNFDNTIRYIKFFLYHRILYLDVLFGVIDIDISEPPTTKDVYVVTLNDGSNISTIMVNDGNAIDIDMLPEIPDPGRYYWHYEKSHDLVSPYIPVYENVSLILYDDQ